MTARTYIAMLLLPLVAGVAGAQEVRTFRGHERWVGGVAFSPDGKTLVSAGADRTIRGWDLATGKGRILYDKLRDAACTVAISPDGRLIAAGCQNGDIPVLSADGQRLHANFGHLGVIMSVAFSPDGKTLATAGIHSTLMIWDPASGHILVQNLSAHRSWVNCLVFTPNGNMVTASSDNTVRLWEHGKEGWKARVVAQAPEGEVRCVAISPDGRRAALGTRYGTVRVVDLADGHVVANLIGHPGDVWALAFTPDGRQLAAGAGDWDRPGEVRLWDTSSWFLRTTLKHSGEVLCLAISPDSRQLAAGSWDTTIKVWDLPRLPGR